MEKGKMMFKFGKRLFFSSIIVFATTVIAKTDFCPCCKESKQKELASSIIQTFHVYDCCDGTIAHCLAQQPVCPLAERLKLHVCRLVNKGKNKKEVLDALRRRAESMVALEPPVDISLSEAKMLGPDSARVTLVAYTCMRCPFCKIIIPEVYQEVVNGSLKDKIRFCTRMFPIRSHPNSAEAALAQEAATAMGKHWEYMLKVYKHFDDFSLEKLPVWAEEVQLSKEEFKKRMGSPETKQKVIASKKEGLSNGVKATPTFFINGRMYTGDMDIETMKDVLEEEYENVGR